MMIFVRALSVLALLAGLAGLTTGLALFGGSMASGTSDVLQSILVAGLGISSWAYGVGLANIANHPVRMPSQRRRSDRMAVN